MTAGRSQVDGPRNRWLVIVAKQLLPATGKNPGGWIKRERPGAQPQSAGLRDSGKAYFSVTRSGNPGQELRMASLRCWDLVHKLWLFL